VIVVYANQNIFNYCWTMGPR